MLPRQARRAQAGACRPGAALPFSGGRPVVESRRQPHRDPRRAQAWQNTLGHCHLKATFPLRQSELIVSLFQTAARAPPARARSPAPRALEAGPQQRAPRRGTPQAAPKRLHPLAGPGCTVEKFASIAGADAL